MDLVSIFATGMHLANQPDKLQDDFVDVAILHKPPEGILQNMGKPSV